MKYLFFYILILGILTNSYSQNLVIEYAGFYTHNDSILELPVNYKLDIVSDSLSFFSNLKMEDSIIDEDLDRIYYKLDKKASYLYNLKTNNFNVKKPSSGNLILLTDAKVYDWKLVKESKFINGFLCYKALGKAMSKFNFGKFEGTVENGYTVEAWYCPTFRFPFGPSNYVDLPGLVFRVVNNRGLGFQIKAIRKVQELTVPHMSAENKMDFLKYYRKIYRKFGGK